MDRIEIYRKSNSLLTGRLSGFGFLRPQWQGQSYRHFREWEGSHRRNPGTGRILRRGSDDREASAPVYSHGNVDMRDYTAREAERSPPPPSGNGVCRLFSPPSINADRPS